MLLVDMSPLGLTEHMCSVCTLHVGAASLLPLLCTVYTSYSSFFVFDTGSCPSFSLKGL